MDSQKIKNLIDQVESQGKENDQLLLEITKDYTEQLDNMVVKIQRKLSESEGDLPIDDLIHYIAELCPIVYYVIAKLEALGIRSDMSEQLRVEKYNQARQSAAGTATDKTSFAELETTDESFVSNIYSRAYKSIKSRVDAAQMTIDALKKSLSAKMLEVQLMRSQNNVMSN